ncbi:MAG: HD domain-containing phosphohydrolase [Planctomycetota bacterium]|jgi:HD-GYP domain-containing protein (c-di-GMP phosphodiesterase class II)
MTDTITTRLSAAQIDILVKFAAKINRFDANFVAFDTTGACVLDKPAGKFSSDAAQLAHYAELTCRSKSDEVQQFGTCNEVLAVALQARGETVGAVVIETSAAATGDNEDLRRFCSQQHFDYVLLEKFMHPDRGGGEYIKEMLRFFVQQFDAASKAAQQLEKVSMELSRTYEELALLYNMSTSTKVTQSNATYLQMACDQVTALVNVEGIAVFVEREIDNINGFVLTAGAGVVEIDNAAADILQTRLAAELKAGKEALLDSEVDSPFKYDWPDGIHNIIAVPLHAGDKIIGVMVATNIINKPDFDSIDIKLYNSVANQCAVFIENNRLFGDLKELFIGSLKSLTNSIDAKDQYTRGHSERVAFISRWIAERLSQQCPMEEDEIHKIYLAGLLHDIGKIGVNEAVLKKEGKLSADDLTHIKTHPRIGADILADIKQMKDVVPGILYHHEHVDGTGYPEGLSGDRIPLIGKIISLADAFDAMTSKRVYREAMSIKRALAEIEKSLGTQFDEEVGRVFLKSDIRELWNIIQDGYIESWDYSNFSEYGTVAVGALIR